MGRLSLGLTFLNPSGIILRVKLSFVWNFHENSGIFRFLFPGNSKKKQHSFTLLETPQNCVTLILIYFNKLASWKWDLVRHKMLTTIKLNFSPDSRKAFLVVNYPEKTKTGGSAIEDILFLPKPPEVYRFVTLPVQIPDKIKLPPGKLCWNF